MLELRILSGLHRGATLPLDEEAVVIGTDESAGIVLLDPGIEAMHASLRKTSDGWALSPLDGNVFGADTNQPVESLDLQPGDFGRIGRVWISVTESGNGWGDPPRDPIDIETSDLQGGSDSETDLRPDDVAEPQGVMDTAPIDANPGQDEAAEEAAAGNTSDVGGKRKKITSRLMLSMIACAIALAAWGAYQFFTETSESSWLKSGMAGAKAGQHLSGGTDQAKRPNATIPATPGPLSQEELRAAFRKRLAEVDLLKSFDLNLRDGAWSMRATLDDDEAARFERILAAFISQHKITFPITAKVGNAEHMLPFKIRQVISGANASVITIDGNRLYVGDEYLGLRLVAIKGSRLTFMGKRKIEVRW